MKPYIILQTNFSEKKPCSIFFSQFNIVGTKSKLSVNLLMPEVSKFAFSQDGTDRDILMIAIYIISHTVGTLTCTIANNFF